MALEATPRPKLTARQQEIYDFIERRIAAGDPPTVREIGAQVGIRNPNGVMCHLRALQRKGVIDRTTIRSRGIAIPEHRRPGMRASLPFWGKIS